MEKDALSRAMTRLNVAEAEVVTLRQENSQLTKDHKESSKEVYESRD